MHPVLKVILIIFLIIFGSLLIANGACTIEWTGQGGIVVNGKKEVVTTDGETVEVATKEEEELLEKSRKEFLQAMSAINILAGIFLYILAGYYIMPETYKKVESNIRKVAKKFGDGGSIVSDGSGSNVSGESNDSTFAVNPASEV